MRNVRIRFSKTGRARYISHLDLSRVMQRSLRRAGIPLWYTEGFNRHPYVTFAAPLSLGFEGLQETMDIRLEQEMADEELVRRLREASPEGITILSAADAVHKPGEIASARYRLIFPGEGETMRHFLDQETIPAEKKTKKGTMKTLDLKPALLEREIKELLGQTELTLLLPCSSSDTVNPLLIWGAYGRFIGREIPSPQVTRMDVYTADGKPFC